MIASAPRSQRGLGVIAAILVLVALAALAAAIVRLSTGASSTAAQAASTARTLLAARSGLEWGLYQAFKGSWTSCSGASQTLDLTADTGARVTVTCSSSVYNEGESAAGVARQLRVYTIDATACSIGASCPDASVVAQPGYVERRLQIVATQ